MTFWREHHIQSSMNYKIMSNLSPTISSLKVIENSFGWTCHDITSKIFRECRAKHESNYTGWLICRGVNSRVFLFKYVNYGSSIIMSKSLSNNLGNKNKHCTGIFVVFKTKRELKCQNELFLKHHFSGNTSLYVFITEIIWWTFDKMIDDQ